MKIRDGVTGKTKIFGVIGNPIEHSISPQLHNTISRYMKIDAAYVPFRVEQDNLQGAVEGFKALNVGGFNVTIPHKKQIMKFIDQNSKEAILMGAVNTVKNVDGKLFGYNTDAEGFSRSFKEETGTGFKDKTVAMIGAGGAARAIAVKIAMEGAKKIFICNRTVSRAVEIVDIVNNNIAEIAACCETCEVRNREIIEYSNIIINTTSVGMYPDMDKSPLEEGFMYNKDQIFYDVVYNPVKTKFLADAERNGCKIVNGLGMLLYQGMLSYEIWMNVKITGEVIRNIFKYFSR